MRLYFIIKISQLFIRFGDCFFFIFSIMVISFVIFCDCGKYLFYFRYFELQYSNTLYLFFSTHTLFSSCIFNDDKSIEQLTSSDFFPSASWKVLSVYNGVFYWWWWSYHHSFHWWWWSLSILKLVYFFPFTLVGLGYTNKLRKHNNSIFPGAWYARIIMCLNLRQQHTLCRRDSPSFASSFLHKSMLTGCT